MVKQDSNTEIIILSTYFAEQHYNYVEHSRDFEKKLCKYQLIAFILQRVIIALLFILQRPKKVFSFPFFPVLPHTRALQTQRKTHALPQWPYPALKLDMTVRMTNNGREGWEEGSKITELHSLAIWLT